MTIALPLTPIEDDAPSEADAFYRQVLRTLKRERLPFLVGGGFAFSVVTGIQRPTKDLDLFVRRQDLGAISDALREHGHRTELKFPHWLAKVYGGEHFVDLIFNSGNGVAAVDDGWFEHAEDGEVLGIPVQLVPCEESLWSKAFVMERERYDGADVAHLLHACADRMDWRRLVDRFGAQWRVLLSHLVLFGFVYPDQRALVPAWVMEELLSRLRGEIAAAPAPDEAGLCGGTLLSREQYLPDVENEGLRDGRLDAGSMTERDVAQWTDAIPSRHAAGS